MQVLLLFALVHVVSSFHIPYPDEAVKEWELFKIEHEKLYGDEKEENVRKEIFMKNLDFIRKHNKKYENGEVTFTVGVNQFADMTNQEFNKIMNGLKIPEGYVSKGRKFEWNENMTVPDTVDWRQQGAVTPVKNQGQCGSCWAFSSTGSLEGQTFLKTKTLPCLSEQNLVDCSTAYGNQGCNGGLMSNSYTYIEENNGIDTEASYPYTAQEGACQYEAENRGATDTGYVSIPRSEISLQQAVADVGPISVAIDASQQSFQFYRGGIYIDPGCSTTQLDHAVLVVGYGTSSGYTYWLVKNSWGTTWGMSGYVLMARNFNNMCGIATMASYPTV